MKKRIVAFLLVVIMLCGCMPIAKAEGEIPEDYIGIYTIEDLYAINYSLNKEYILMSDLDLSGNDWNWTPLGKSSTVPFSGVFDGNNHTISGLKCELFGYVTGTIKDLVLKDVSINTNETICGALAKRCSGTIESVHVSGSITANQRVNIYDAESERHLYLGGIVGYLGNGGRITDSSNEAIVSITGYYVYRLTYTIKVTSNTGGICGYADSNTEILKCFNLGNISSSLDIYNDVKNPDYYPLPQTYTGGICGYLGAEIKNSYNTGTIESNAVSYYKGYDGKDYQRHYGYAGGISIMGNASYCINMGSVNGYQESYSITKGNYSCCYRLAKENSYGTNLESVTAERMKLKSTFVKLDFKDYWFIDISNGINHPQLKDNPEGDPHEHIYAESWVNPTCESQGYKLHQCTGCDEFYQDEIVDAIGHSWDSGSVKNEPTCTENGTREYTCLNNPKHIKTEPIPLLGHNYVAAETAPTCLDGGYITYYCSRCEDHYVKETEPATGHDWNDGVVTTTPSCLSNGIKTYTCKNDQTHTYTELIPALGHSYNVVVIKPTCDEDGYSVYTCIRCGANYVDDVTPATGHDWDSGKITEDATCDKAGIKTFVCKNNPSHTKNESIAAIGHEWDDGTVTKEATCTEDGEMTFKCTHDNNHTRIELIPKSGHSYKSKIVDPTCTQNGYTIYTCVRCGDVYTDSVTNPIGHNYALSERIEPTCTEDGSETYTCLHCLDSYTNSIGKLGHNYHTALTEPTCETKGYTTYSCFRCGKVSNSDFVDELGHKWSQGVVTKPASCTEEGILTYTCLCDDSHIRTEPISLIAHCFGTWSTTKPSTEYEEGTEERTCSVCGEKESRSKEKLPRTELKLNKTSLDLIYKDSETLTASEAVRWSSSNEKVVKIDANGRITTVGKGTATITANSIQGGKTATCEVTVEYTFVQTLIRILLLGFIWY